MLYLDWRGNVLHFDPKQYLRQFNILRLNKVTNRVWGCMWIVIIGEIWKKRNNILLRNATVDPLKNFVLSQVKTWSWITGKESTTFAYYYWCIILITCLKSIKKQYALKWMVMLNYFCDYPHILLNSHCTSDRSIIIFHSGNTLNLWRCFCDWVHNSRKPFFCFGCCHYFVVKELKWVI